MSWLPAIRVAGNRWWLPLSRSAADLIAGALVQPAGASISWTNEFIELMRVDPAMAIFAAVTCQSRNQSSVSLEGLATAFIANLPGIFASGDVFLSAPVERECFVNRWNELHASFIRMPMSRWTASSDQWLSLTGPVVPKAFLDSLPSIEDEPAAMLVRSGDFPYYSDASKLDLSLLARKLRRSHTLGQSFGEALQESKRLALKQFAYGLSHEINNPLANISARAQGLMRDESEPVRKISLQRIVEQSMRAHEMVADLMFYAHPPAPVIDDVDLTEVLRVVAESFDDLIAGRAIEIRVKHAESKVQIRADRAMMIEAIRSLVRNSIEAIGVDGRIELSCSIEPSKPRNIAVILVCDSGPGLSDEARKHAFDPYFSGREAGRGLGVGLCRAQRIATLHQGGISLISGLAGCTARLWIRGSS